MSSNKRIDKKRYIIRSIYRLIISLKLDGKVMLESDNMSQNSIESSAPTKMIQYRYVIECKEKTVELEVDDRDVIKNADDELDCPLDVVLRKNNYSFNDLMTWDAREICFVKVMEEDVSVINRISMNVNI